MSDRFIPIGKYVPPAPAQTALPIGTQIGGDPADLSFDQVLSRQQASAAQVQTLKPPVQRVSQPHHFAASSTPTQIGMQDEVVLNPQVLAEQNPDLPPEILDLLRKAPAQAVQGNDFDAVVLQNAADYRNMKIQDLGPPNYREMNASLAPKPQISTSYSGFNLQNTAAPSQITGASPAQAMQPINADLYTGSYNDVLSQADVQPLVQNKRELTEEDLLQLQRAYQQNEDHEEKQSLKAVPENPGERKGVTQAVGSFFGNIASGLSMGFYRPAGEPEPQGAARVLYPFKKLIVDTPMSLVVGVPMGIANSVSGNHGTDTPQMNPQVAEARIRYSGSSKPWLNHRYRT